MIFLAFLLWLRGKEPNSYPRGCGFDPWPCSVGKGSGVAVSCGVGRICGLDPVLLRVWCSPVATAPISHLAWEPTYAAGEVLKGHKDKKKNKNKNKKTKTKTKT